jgi:hypothetical protein
MALEADARFSVYEVARMLRVPVDEVVERDTLARAAQGKRAKHRKPSANRVKRYRLRQRNGHVVLKIEVPEAAIAEFLISSGRLAPHETLLRSKVEDAIAAAVVNLAARWNPSKL